MPYSIPVVPRSDASPYSFFEKFLSDEECQKVIEIAKSMPPKPAFIGGAGVTGVVDPIRRSSDLRWLEWAPEYEWLFNRIAVNIATTNAKWFGFKLIGMNEALQMTHYKAKESEPTVVAPDVTPEASAPPTDATALVTVPAPVDEAALLAKAAAVNGHYSWHEDHAENGPFSMRKLSFIIPLNDGYEGGRFQLLHSDVPQQGKGNMIVFPSYKTHCVEPVTKGERWSLVGWVTGPPFR